MLSLSKTANPAWVQEQLQPTVLEKAKRLRAEAVRTRTDLLARWPRAFPGHSLRARAKRMRARFRWEMASHPAATLVELVLAEPASVAQELLRVEAPPSPWDLRLHRAVACEVFLFSRWPFARRAPVGPRDVPSVAESEPQAAAPMQRRDPPR